MGYCMGGTLAAMHAALHPNQVRALVLLGTPVDFHNSGILATWTQEGRFNGDMVADAFGNVPPWMLQSAFKAMAAADLPRKWTDLVKRADDEDAVRHFVALESWLEDNVAFPGGLYREYIKGCYQENRLVRDDMKVGNRVVHLKDINMPLLNVIALRDRICEPPASRALMDRASSSDKQALEFDTGHIGLTTSKRSLAELWPRVTTWLIEKAPV
jgi:polyhydroxyalkanoate synthase